MSKYLAGSLMIVAFIAGTGFGYYLTSDYAVLKSVSAHGDLGKLDKYLDLRFINGMIAHHKAALFMVNQVKKNSKRQEMLDYADLITALDTRGIEELYGMKQKFYGDRREVTKFGMMNIGPSDEFFDLRFLNAMIAHHEEAITVSKDLMSKSHRPETIRLADATIKLLTDNMAALKEWRLNWYNVK